MKSAEEMAQELLYVRGTAAGFSQEEVRSALEQHAADVRADERAKVADLLAAARKLSGAWISGGQADRVLAMGHLDKVLESFGEDGARGRTAASSERRGTMSSNMEGLRETLRCFCAQFKGAVDEAHATLHKVADMMPDEIGSEHEQRLSDHLTAAHNALHRVGAGQPHAKSPAESRADEIEVEAAREGSKLRFTEALRHAREAWEDVGLAVGSNSAAARKLDTAAWLIVGQRILAREAVR